MSTPARKPAAIVHIEELVLHGFAPGDRYRIGEAVQRELVRLLGEQGVPPPLGQGGEIAYLDGGSFKVTSNKPETVGAQVAQAVHGSLQR